MNNDTDLKPHTMKTIVLTLIMFFLIFRGYTQRLYQLEYNAGLSNILIQYSSENIVPFNYQFSQQFRVQKEFLTIGSMKLNGGIAFSNLNAELDNFLFLEQQLISLYDRIPEGVFIENFKYSGFMVGPMIMLHFTAYQKGKFSFRPGFGIDGFYLINETMSNNLYNHFTSYYGANKLDQEINSVKVLDDVYFGANLRLYLSYSLTQFTILIGPGIDYQLNNLVKPENNKHVFMNYCLSLGVKF